MTPPPVRVVLASASPRRLELLSQLPLQIEVRPADIDESVLPDEDPVQYVRRLSVEKAATVWADTSPDDVIVAADTTVDLNGVILGKPDDAGHAIAMLRTLAGTTHRVHTGVTVRHAGRTVTRAVTTFVRFTPISDAALAWYVGTGEPFGKAGAYAIQGAGGVFVESVDGSVSNVVGLPLAAVVHMAQQMGVDLLAAGQAPNT
jgi:septum formation protein